MDNLLFKLVDPFLDELWEKFSECAHSSEHTSVFESLQNHLRLLCTHSSDIKHQIENIELSGIKKRKRAVECWLEQVQSVETEIGTLLNDIQRKGFVKKFFSKGQAKKLDGRVSELVEQRPRFDELVDDDHNVRGDEFLTKKLVGEGFKEQFQRIWQLLVTENVSSVGIHGMGGVGKTTLAKHVNNQLLKETQYCVIWITVSQQYSVLELQNEIAGKFHIDISNLRNEDIRSTKLHKGMSKMENVILIFDDVWENIDLMKMGDPLSIDSCRLMITTRSKKVCQQIGCKEIIEVKTLQDNETWILFKKIHGPELYLTPEVEDIVKSTIELCKGLPLGIITLAGSMKGETTYHVWSDILAELKESVMRQPDMDEKVFNVLKLSFDRLSLREKRRNGYSRSQLCFLYCSMYPEDYLIDEEELIHRFIAEGYLERKGSSRETLFNEGRSILDNLVSVCLLERPNTNGEIKMHDLLREMALTLTDGKSKVFDGIKSSFDDILKEALWIEDIENISLWNISSECFSKMMSPTCPNLSTLILNRYNRVHFLSVSPWYLTDLFFSGMHGLCTLDMSGSGVEVLPKSLSDVVTLKALFCAHCGCLRYVPNLGKLKKLEELDFSWTFLKELPQGIEELVSLKFLSFSGNYRMEQSELELNCTNIQYLLLSTKIHLHGGRGGGVAALKHLEKFHGQLEDVRSLFQLMRSKPKLNFKIAVGQCQLSCTDHLSKIASACNELALKGYEFNDRDEDLALFSKTNVRGLELNDSQWQSKSITEHVVRMCDPTFLLWLKVKGGEGIEWLMRREECMDNGAYASITPAVACPVFSSLQELLIWNCNKVKNLGLILSHFPMLGRLQVGNCAEMEEIMEGDDEAQQHYGISNNSVASSLPNLTHLFVNNLPKLKSICNVTIACPSISRITLKKCQELKKLPLIFGQQRDSPPPDDLCIKLTKGSEEWWEALELGHSTHRGLLKPEFASY